MSSSMPRAIPLEILVEQKLEQQTLIDNTRRIERLGPSIICRVPAHILKANENLYEPVVVSIGPYYYHLRQNRLREMEDHKWRLLRSFVRRNSELHVETYVKELRLLEERVRQSYSEPIDLESDDFIQMLLLDGCFILELSMKKLGRQPDELLTKGRSQTKMLSDLALSENQIPLVVIERLYDIVKAGEASRVDLLDDLGGFLDVPPHLLGMMQYREITSLAHLYHQYYVGNIRRKPLVRDMPRLGPYNIPSATKLDEAGVEFGRFEFVRSSCLVKFKGGVLGIHRVEISSDTKVLLANLAEAERHYKWEDQVVTSYLQLMNSLIKRKEDVVLLQLSWVIDNKLSSEQEAVDFFRQLCDGTNFDPCQHFFEELFQKVAFHYCSRWNRNRTALIRGYCNSPWAVISWFAGVILLVLTGLQTFYTVYPYYRPN